MAIDQHRRLDEAAAAAHAAQDRGDHWAANDAWRRYVDAALNDSGAALRDLNAAGARYVVVGGRR